MKEKKELEKVSKVDNTQERRKALQTAIDTVKKQYGEGSIMALGDKPVQKVETVSTSCLSLDFALGGGLPRGRTIEIFGPEMSGKSTVAMQIVGEVQKDGGTAAYIDAEHAMDLVYAQNIGVNIQTLLLSQPDSGEEALQIVETLVRSGAVDIIVVDSVAALVPLKEIEGEMGDPTMGAQARLMSQALRKLTAIVGKTKTILVFINQIRMAIGILFGNPERTTGGNALKFYSSVRLDVRKVESIKEGLNVIGARSRIKVVKNKVAPPFKETIVDIIFGKGISREGDLFDLAVEGGILEKSGSWFAYKGNKIGQGRDTIVSVLRKDPIFFEEVRKEVIARRENKENLT